MRRESGPDTNPLSDPSDDNLGPPSPEYYPDTSTPTRTTLLRERNRSSPPPLPPPPPTRCCSAGCAGRFKELEGS